MMAFVALSSFNAFPDEPARGLAVVTYGPRWPGDFVTLASRVIAGWGRPIDEQVRNATDPEPE
jgi:hypothetical protein